jgi:predicted PurR-regulated permease PerM
MNPAIALIGAIGGVYAFGFLGFLLGPLFLACLILLVELYKDKKSEESIVIRETNESKLSQLEKTPEKTEKVLA